MSFETTNGLKNGPEVISEGLKIKNFSGGACPQTPLEGALPRTYPLPPKIFSKSHFAPPPLYIFLNETLMSLLLILLPTNWFCSVMTCRSSDIWTLCNMVLSHSWQIIRRFHSSNHLQKSAHQSCVRLHLVLECVWVPYRKHNVAVRLSLPSSWWQ